jgi:hypothetical protein
MTEISSQFDVPLAAPDSCDNSAWQSTYRRFLQAVPIHRRDEIAALVNSVHNGGSGLREWISAIAWRGAVLPMRIPDEIINVYLSDPEAAPVHDCEGCGMAIPVRPSRLDGLDGEPDRVYFATCPACGARTGLFMYFSRQFEQNLPNKLRRRPR